MTRTAKQIQAVELKLSPIVTALEAEAMSQRMKAFVGQLGGGRPEEEPDYYLLDGQQVEGAQMWRRVHASPTVSVPRPPLQYRFLSADPMLGPRLAEMRHEALLRQLHADVLGPRHRSPVTVASVPPARHRSNRKRKDVDALLGKVEFKITKEMRRQGATEAEIRNALHDRLFSQHSPAVSQIIKDELGIGVSDRTVRRQSRRYESWAAHRKPTAAPLIDTDVGPACSREDGETAARSATGQSVTASRADAARQSLHERELWETRPGRRGCRTTKSVDERQLDRAGDEVLRAAGHNPADFPAD